MRFAAILLSGSLLSGCSDGAGEPVPNGAVNVKAPAVAVEDRATGWDLQSGSDGLALVLGPPAGTEMRLFCPAGERRLLVNVPAFRPIGSEERLSFGGGGNVVALVADTSGDSERGGVSGTGPTPDNLETLLTGPVSASYGAQTSGPHGPPPEQLARAFAAACARPATRAPAETADEIGACRKEDGEIIPPNALKAVGTEPFWAARIDGRCVTYMTPENQDGTRIWTSFDGSRDSGVWTGYYKDQRFVLRTRPAPGCSDGMSDKRYPVGVTLVVEGEERMGCAEYR